MTSKKFALIGTSCVGKTTLLLEIEQMLEKRYPDKTVVIVPEAARYFFEKKKAHKPFSYINQRAIQNIAKSFEENAERKNPDIIVCDRSVFDAIAYVKTKGTAEETRKLLRRVKEWLKTYSYFFLLDPEGVPYQVDSIRKEEEVTRAAFHLSFLNLLEELTLPYTLISGNKEQRFERVKEIILSFNI